ncbi:ABC transporter substrate binding protein [Bacteroides sp.]|uniref:sensor histidine kinase n=1 Tax=Bacteroides sp. TaxID=29523 RepID=UPI001B7202F8|nr:ABC transporter substrate binding protein [Bacteroides sp.]MBP6937072.1 PAS domain S-box protein [Bacteroides sp.]
MNNRHRYIFLLLFLLFSLGAVASERVFSVLYIQSYEALNPWQNEMLKGLTDGLTKSGVKANVVIEHLDAERWTYTSEKVIMRRICERARKRGVDIIVTSEDESLYTLLTCGDSLAQTVPVVFFAVKHPDYEQLNNYPNVTGFVSKPDFCRILEQAHRMFPNRTEVICVSDNSFLSTKSKETFQKAFELFKEKHPDFQLAMYNTHEKTTNEIIAGICYPRNTANRMVIIPKWSLFMQFLGKNSKAPFFVCQNAALMNGAFCAYDADSYVAAKLAGIRAGKVLKGNSPESFGISDTPKQFIYDYKQLTFFHIDKSKATPGVVINEPYWDKYRVLIILFYASILGGFALLVAWLIRANRREASRRILAQTRLLLQNRLVSQRDEFNNIFHSIRDGVITYDTDLRIHFINRAMLKMLDLTEESASSLLEGTCSEEIIQIYHGKKEILCDLLKQVLKEGKSVILPDNSFMHKGRAKDFFLVSGEVVPIRANDRTTGVAISFRNISDEEMQRRFFNLAVNESSIYPWQFNVNKEIVTFSESFLKRIGLATEQNPFTLQSLRELIHPDDLNMVQEFYHKITSETSESMRINFRQRDDQGVYEWWEYRTSVLNGVTQELSHTILGVCQNIQRYKSTEQALTEARDKALQADNLKTAFLANMSHEIRTPLNAIVGFSDLLTDMDHFSKKELREFIVTINKNCALLLSLINDILDLSRIESGAMDFRFARHNLLFLLKNVYDSQRLNMPPNVELILDAPLDTTRYINTDSVRLQQVVNNLINNAVKFTTQGSITFGYTIDEPDTVTLFVEDTGKGISEEDVQNIFQRFYKVDNFTQGVGLGLSICQTIVERLHGSISVTSGIDKGTRFLVKIPDSCFFEPSPTRNFDCK